MTLTNADLNEAVVARQGLECIMPDCDRMWAEKAHIVPSGMGGRPSLRVPENLAGMCSACHDVFDGRELHGRQQMLRTLMKFLAERTADARLHGR